MIQPLEISIPYEDLTQVAQRFHHNETLVLLHGQHEHLSRYSFLGLDPYEILIPSQDLLARLREPLNHRLVPHSNRPPFQGGAMGFMGYEVSHQLENLPFPKSKLPFPSAAFGLFDLVIAQDHQTHKAWLYSSGLPEQNSQKRLARAKSRADHILKYLQHPHQPLPREKISQPKSNFTKASYIKAIKRAQDYIRAGDIFQVNLSQCWQAHITNPKSAFSWFEQLALRHPAPFASYVKFGETQLLSTSPERFLSIHQGCVEARPIKGTVPRGKTPEADQKLANQLIDSEKDKAENVMIVDLLRNDLSRVCQDHSIQVPQLCKLESYSNVHHLVSVIQGRLRSDCNAINTLSATFPCGSITGAPKIRAMEIISELEQQERGPYCGCIGYLGFDGCMDMSVTIRTLCIQGNQVFYQAGGAITIDSDPEKEYEETLNKASAFFELVDH